MVDRTTRPDRGLRRRRRRRTTWCTRSGQPTSRRVDRRGARNFAAAAARGRRAADRLPGRPGARRRRGLRRTCAPGPRSARSCWPAAVPTVVLRAAVIIGSGSASFEMLRYLTERLPVMVTPRWVQQPDPADRRSATCCATWSAAADAARPTVNRAFDIGGPDVLTYARDDAALRPGGRAAAAASSAGAGADARGCPSHWVGLVTPVPNAIARPLVASLIHEAVCHEHDIAGYVPDPPGGLTGFDDAVAAGAAPRSATPTWRPAGPTRPARTRPADPLPTDPAWSGGTVYTDVREPRRWTRRPSALWRVIEAIGGEQRLVLVPAGLVGPRLAGPAGRRGRAAPGPARPAPPAGRRGAGLLAGRGDRAGRAAAAARRDAAPGPGLAGDAGRAADGRPQPSTGSAPSSCPGAWPGTPTGRRWRPSTRVVFGGMARNIARTAEQTP